VRFDLLDGLHPSQVDDAIARGRDAGVLTEDGKAHGHHAPPISDSLRRRILARDGYRCRVCDSRDQLHVHHIVWRSKHGLNAWANCMAACTDCHTLVHGGFLTITGRAPDRLEIRDRKGELLADPARVLGDAARTCLEISAAPPPATGPETPAGGGPAGQCR
jgi:HNH endonuclease